VHNLRHRRARPLGQADQARLGFHTGSNRVAFRYAAGIAAQDQGPQAPPGVDIEGPGFLTGAPGEPLECGQLRAGFEAVSSPAREPLGDLTFED